jgi:hypothetical protein
MRARPVVDTLRSMPIGEPCALESLPVPANACLALVVVAGPLRTRQPIMVWHRAAWVAGDRFVLCVGGRLCVARRQPERHPANHHASCCCARALHPQGHKAGPVDQTPTSTATVEWNSQLYARTARICVREWHPGGGRGRDRESTGGRIMIPASPGVACVTGTESRFRRAHAVLSREVAVPLGSRYRLG